MEASDNVQHSAEQRDHDNRVLKQVDTNPVSKDGHSEDGQAPSSSADASAKKRYGLRKKRAGGSETPPLQFTAAGDKENVSGKTKEWAAIGNRREKKKAPFSEKIGQDDTTFKEAEQEEEQREEGNEEWTPKRMKRGKRKVVVLSCGKEKVNEGERENMEGAPTIRSKSAKKETKKPSKKDEKLILDKKDEKIIQEFIYTTLDLDDLAPAALLSSEPVVGKVSLIREAPSVAKPIRVMNLDPVCEDVGIDESTPNNSPVKLAGDSNAMGNISETMTVRRE